MDGNPHPYFVTSVHVPKPLPSPPVPPPIPTGRELYDALMQHIEPELTTEGRKKLAAAYKDETPENKAARMQRYELAFERCEQAYQDYMKTLDTQVNRYRREAFKHAELRDRSRSQDFFDQFNSLIQNPAA